MLTGYKNKPRKFFFLFSLSLSNKMNSFLFKTNLYKGKKKHLTLWEKFPSIYLLSYFLNIFSE